MTIKPSDTTLKTTLALVAAAAAGTIALGVLSGINPALRQLVLIVWIGATVLGIGDTITTLRECVVERYAAGNDEIGIGIANASVRREVFRMTEMIAFGLVAILALGGFSPDHPSVGILLILFAIILLIVNARLDRRERQHTAHLIRLERAKLRDGV